MQTKKKKGYIFNLVGHYPAGPVLAIQVLVFLPITLIANKNIFLMMTSGQ